MAARKDKNPSKKKDKYRIRNWGDYNAPQAHGQASLEIDRGKKLHKR